MAAINVAIDIEMGGMSPIDHPLMAIGVCVGSVVGNFPVTHEIRTWCLKPLSDTAMEDRCVREFWSKYPGVRARIEAAAEEPMAQLHSFNDWLNGLQARFPGREIVFLSDNPAYDIGILDFVLIHHGVRRTQLRYLADGEYRDIQDWSEVLRGTECGKVPREAAKAVVEHDHWPSNDATFHFYANYFTVNRLVEFNEVGAGEIECVFKNGSCVTIETSKN